MSEVQNDLTAVSANNSMGKTSLGTQSVNEQPCFSHKSHHPTSPHPPTFSAKLVYLWNMQLTLECGVIANFRDSIIQIVHSILVVRFSVSVLYRMSTIPRQNFPTQQRSCFCFILFHTISMWSKLHSGHKTQNLFSFQSTV